VVRKDPENYEIKIVEESLSKPAVVKQEVEIEIPSVIDAPAVVKQVRVEESLTKPPIQLTIDSPGAYIKLDREPDHAIIPIVVATTPVQKTTKVDKESTAPTTTAVEVITKAATKSKKESKPKKTSPIDMPLINILAPKSGNDGEAKKKPKKEKKQKTKSEKTRAEVRFLVEDIFYLILLV